MSYLIALYVYYHGNNLGAFGFVKGEDPNAKPNQGFHYTKEQLEDLLPREVAEAMQKEEEFKKLNDYESILAKAIMESQTDSRKMMNSNTLHMENPYYGERDLYGDDDGVIDLNFFDSLNGF